MPADLRHSIYKKGAVLDEKQVCQRAQDFLARHAVGVLSTIHDGAPEGCAMEYKCEGLTVYLLSEPSRKLANILANPRVGFTVFSMDPAEPGVHEVFVEGKAEILESQFLAPTAELSNQPWRRNIQGLRHATNMDLNSVKIVKINPVTVKILDFSLPAQGFSAVQRAKATNKISLDRMADSTSNIT
jgi:hypothetical protein